MKRIILLGGGAACVLAAGLGVPLAAATAAEAVDAQDVDVVIEVDDPPPAVQVQAPVSSPAVAQTVQARAPVQVQSQVQTQTAAPVTAPAQDMSLSAQVPPQIDLPGVLTRRGTLVVEPSIEYSHSDVNQFAFGGVSILDVVLVGAIEANQANRDAVTATLGLRYGITSRLEGELRIPYMYRNDKTTDTFVNSSNISQETSLDSHGLGDVEAALHYQLNDGTGKWPVFVANFRAKSNTGEGPYDVSRNSLGIEEDLATGSGFWGFEPSVTVIAPSDPAVFYASLGYLWNVSKDYNNKQIGSRTVTHVDPGDAVRLSFGMGLALNEKISFSVGYQHDFIMETEAKFTDGTVNSDSLSVGTLNLGVNWQMADDMALNVSVGVGVTNDAPDVRLIARLPISFDLLK